MIAWQCVLWRAWQGLAAAYVSSGVLPSSYFGNEDAFFLRSDDTDRTIQSGQALFTGMYPPASSGDTEVVGWNTMDRSAYSSYPCHCGVVVSWRGDTVPDASISLLLSPPAPQRMTPLASTRCCAPL